MTLEEAIKHAEEVAEKQENNAKSYPRPDKSVKGSGKKYNTYLKCAEEYRQIAEWLKDYKRLLEQEPCEDCISREAAIKGLGEEPYVWTDSDFEIQQLSDWKQYKKMLENLPPVTPKPKTGHWMAQDIHNCHTIFRCSECGYIHNFMHLYGKPTADYTYCPNCGAKMGVVE